VAALGASAMPLQSGRAGLLIATGKRPAGAWALAHGAQLLRAGANGNMMIIRVGDPLTALRALADSAAQDDPLSHAHALAFAVAGAIAYRPGSTHSHTTAAEALAQGEGVCQDHAQALIACARHAGFPARYVAGYLFSSEDGTPHEASHAWAELHVPGYGWIGFDPANRCCPDERYIRLGSGLDAAEAAPIKGIARGLGAESLSVTVAIQSQAQ
jgi:transglutaminase-like putative cysteine protease